MIWGLQVSLTNPAGAFLLRGHFAPAAFTDIWVRGDSGGGDERAAAAYQSVLESLEWGDISTSRCLQELRSIAGDGTLSIKFNLDGYSMRRGTSQFTKGRLVGTMGPSLATELRHFARGRHFAVLENLNPAGLFVRPKHGINYCAAIVDEIAGKVRLDLGNALPTSPSRGPMKNLGALSLASPSTTPAAHGHGLSQARQLEGPLGFWKISSLEDVRRAIQLTQHQGEGSQVSPGSGVAGEFAHYYRFKEIDTGHKIRLNQQTGHWEFTGDPVPFPAAWPMAVVPAGGYAQAAVAPEVWTLIDQFDGIYTELLGQLQLAWQTGSDDALSVAIDAMYQLRGPAVALMKISLPGSAQTYGPCFRLKQGANPSFGVVQQATTTKGTKGQAQAIRVRRRVRATPREQVLQELDEYEEPHEQTLGLLTEMVRQNKRNAQMQAQTLQLLEAALAASSLSAGGASSAARAAAIAELATMPAPPAVAAGNRRLVYVHGICQHAAGFCNPWWNALKPYVGGEFGLGTQGATRLEVVWSDLVNEAVAALAAAPAAASNEQLEVAQEIRHTLKDRLDRHAFAVAPPGVAGAALVPDAVSLVSIPGLSCVDDFTIYLTNNATRQQIISRFIQVVQRLMSNNMEIDIVSHSWGTVVAYEGLRQFVPLAGKVRNFFRVGAALSIGAVQRHLRPENRDGQKPGMVGRWINLNAHGDVVGGRLQGRPYQVDDDFPNLDPVGCGCLLGLVNPVCAHSSYFQAANVATNRDIFAEFINQP